MLILTIPPFLFSGYSDDGGTGLQSPRFFLHRMIMIMIIIIKITIAAITAIQIYCHKISSSFSIIWVNCIGFPSDVSTMQVTFPTSSWVRLKMVSDSFVCLKYLQESKVSNIQFPFTSNSLISSLHFSFASTSSITTFFELCSHWTVLLRSSCGECV